MAQVLLFIISLGLSTSVLGHPDFLREHETLHSALDEVADILEPQQETKPQNDPTLTPPVHHIKRSLQSNNDDEFLREHKTLFKAMDELASILEIPQAEERSDQNDQPLENEADRACKHPKDVNCLMTSEASEFENEEEQPSDEHEETTESISEVSEFENEVENPSDEHEETTESILENQLDEPAVHSGMTEKPSFVEGLEITEKTSSQFVQNFSQLPEDIEQEVTEKFILPFDVTKPIEEKFEEWLEETNPVQVLEVDADLSPIEDLEHAETIQANTAEDRSDETNEIIIEDLITAEPERKIQNEEPEEQTSLFRKFINWFG